MKLLPIPFLLSLATALPTSDDLPQPTFALNSHSGSLCPKGSVSVLLSPSYSPTGMYQIISTMTAVTPNAGNAMSAPNGASWSKNCAFQVTLGLPRDYQFRPVAAGNVVRGYLWLPFESLKASFYGSFVAPVDDFYPGSWKGTVDGPIDGRFSVEANEMTPTSGWSACGGGTFSINFRLSVSGTKEAWPGYLGPEVGEETLKWNVPTVIEIKKCR